MDLLDNWSDIRKMFNQSIKSSLHCAFASVDTEGRPHVTPIGSLFLTRPACGIYFEEYARQLPRNLLSHKANSQAEVCILAVNSSVWFWFKSLLLGRFVSPPALRLCAKVGDLRPASDAELSLWRKRIGPMAYTPGGKKLWPKMGKVRDLYFSELREVNFGTAMHSGFIR